MNAYLRIARLAVLPLVFGMAACDNPVEQEEHAEGLVVLNASGAEVARYMFDGGVGVVTGRIDVGVGASSTFTVHAVSDDGDLIEIDGDEFSLELGEMHPGWTATLQGANQVVITTSETGGSPLRITLMHEGHPEFNATFGVFAE